jgi:hypothetical protein
MRSRSPAATIAVIEARPSGVNARTGPADF